MATSVWNFWKYDLYTQANLFSHYRFQFFADVTNECARFHRKVISGLSAKKCKTQPPSRTCSHRQRKWVVGRKNGTPMKAHQLFFGFLPVFYKMAFTIRLKISTTIIYHRADNCTKFRRKATFSLPANKQKPQSIARERESRREIDVFRWFLAVFTTTTFPLRLTFCTARGDDITDDGTKLYGKVT